MGFKRPRPPAKPTASGGSSSNIISTEPPSKKPRDSAPAELSGLKIHIVQAKLDAETVTELLGLVEDCGAVHVNEPEDAEVLVTAITMRRRLERHVPWELAVGIRHLQSAHGVLIEEMCM